MRDCVGCDGVSLAKSSQDFLRQLIKTEEASYVDLRNYLFSRQCNLLLKLDRRAWEIAQRTLEFLHNIIHELAMDKLEVCDLCSLLLEMLFGMLFIQTLWTRESHIEKKGSFARKLVSEVVLGGIQD